MWNGEKEFSKLLAEFGQLQYKADTAAQQLRDSANKLYKYLYEQGKEHGTHSN